MSTADTPAGRPQPPDPTQERRAAAAPAAAPVGRLLVLIRWIISYGTELANTIHQRAARPDFKYFAARYRNGDLAVIIARIRRGLLLAAGLEAKLAEQAARGRDVPFERLRLRSPRRRLPEGPKQSRQPRRTPFIDLPLNCRPTAEEIADEVRRRPVGAVLVDICRDLGLQQCDLPKELWRDFNAAILLCGGRLNALICGEFNASEQHQAVLRQFHGKRSARGSPAVAFSTVPP